MESSPGGAGLTASGPAAQATADVHVPRGWVAIGALILGTVWMLAAVCMFVTGYTTTVTVIGGDGEGFCDVVWEAPSGGRLSGEADCYDEPAGSRFDVRVTGWPDAGEPTLVETYLGVGLLFGLPPFALGAGRLVQLHLRRRAVARTASAVRPRRPGAAAPEPPGAPALAGDRTATAVGGARRRAWALLALGAVSACGLVAVGTVLDRMDAEFMAAGVRTTGTVVQVDENFRGNSGSASVRFTVDGASRTHDVDLRGSVHDYSEGQDVVVIHDPVTPSRFTIDDLGYEPAWGSLILFPLLAGTLLAIPIGGWLVVANRRARRMLRDRPWSRVGVRAFRGERRCWFVTSDGSIWRSQADDDGTWVSAGGAYWYDWRPPDSDESAWWVTEGRNAVFSPDEGATLVRAHRRPALPRRILRALSATPR